MGDDDHGLSLLKDCNSCLAAVEEKAGTEPQGDCVPGPSAAPGSSVVPCRPSPVFDLAVPSTSSALPQPMGMYGSLLLIGSTLMSPDDTWLAALWGQGS